MKGQARKVELRFVAATMNISHARLTATAMAKTAAAVPTPRPKHRLELRKVLRWRMPKSRIWRLIV